MRVIVFIPIFLRVVVSLSTTSSPNIASPVLSVMDQVREQRSATQTAFRRHFAFNESVVQVLEKYEIPVTAMVDYCEATNTLPKSTMDQVRVLEQKCQNYENENRALRQRYLGDDDLVRASNNYERILELPVITMIDYTKLPNSSTTETYMLRYLKDEWESIHRGKDLFLPGMGGFNIPQTYDTVVARRHKAWKEWVLACLQDDELECVCRSLGMTEKTREDILLAEQSSAHVVQIAMAAIQADISSNHFSYLLRQFDNFPCWFVTVCQLQTWGYFGDALEEMISWGVRDVEKNLLYVFGLPEDSPQRQHLIKYYHSWSEQENLASLDEIFWATKQDAFWPEGWERMQPSTLLDALREHQREVQLADSGGDVTFSHLSDLRDSESLRVLRSSREVRDVGLALNNCALSYAKSVELEECILIAKYDDVEKNKPIALGMIDQYVNGLAETWSQIYLSCNRAAPEEVKQEFYDYETVLRPWFRKKYATEQERLQ